MGEITFMKKITATLLCAVFLTAPVRVESAFDHKRLVATASILSSVLSALTVGGVYFGAVGLEARRVIKQYKNTELSGRFCETDSQLKNAIREVANSLCEFFRSSNADGVFDQQAIKERETKIWKYARQIARARVASRAKQNLAGVKKKMKGCCKKDKEDSSGEMGDIVSDHSSDYNSDHSRFDNSDHSRDDNPSDLGHDDDSHRDRHSKVYVEDCTQKGTRRGSSGRLRGEEEEEDKKEDPPPNSPQGPSDNVESVRKTTPDDEEELDLVSFFWGSGPANSGATEPIDFDWSEF
jgi:hypothetical protein